MIKLSVFSCQDPYPIHELTSYDPEFTNIPTIEISEETYARWKQTMDAFEQMQREIDLLLPERERMSPGDFYGWPFND